MQPWVPPMPEHAREGVGITCYWRSHGVVADGEAMEVVWVSGPQKRYQHGYLGTLREQSTGETTYVHFCAHKQCQLDRRRWPK